MDKRESNDEVTFEEECEVVEKAMRLIRNISDEEAERLARNGELSLIFHDLCDMCRGN